MSEILVLYASTHGHTSRVAAGVAQALERSGAHADLRTIALGDDVTPTRYDAVVVGAGPNGLTAAITLAKGGRSVLCVESAATLGGCAGFAGASAMR